MQACPDDDVLLRGVLDEALELHLDACSACRQVLAAVISEGQAPSTRRIDRYEIERTLGAGGMGVVYAARDPKLHRMVAVKVLRGTNFERMQREARVMAQLAHPHVVNVFDTGEADGRVFVAMELLGGGTLRSWMSSKHSVQETLRIFRQAGEGLAAAHDAGIVHRDFKPENVLLGVDGRVRVSDFGLANFVPTADQLIRTDGLHTGPVGTLAYMAPEQLEGAVVDARADQYAFCVSLYEALAGERPTRPPSPLDVPMWNTLERGLSVEPSRRFASMRALLTSLDARPSRAPWLLVPLVAAVCVAMVVALDVEEPLPAPLPTTPPTKKWDLGPPKRQVERDLLVEPSRVDALPKPGTSLFLSPESVRAFGVDGLTVVRIGNPDIVDVDGSSDELIITGRALGRTELTLEFKNGKKTWPVEVRTPVAQDVRFVSLEPGKRITVKQRGVSRVTIGDATVVNLERQLEDDLDFIALRDGTTNVFIWTEDATRIEYRFDVTSSTSRSLKVGIQEVMNVTDVARATVAPAASCEAQLLGPDELLLIPQSAGNAVLTLQHADGTEEYRSLKISEK